MDKPGKPELRLYIKVPQFLQKKFVMVFPEAMVAEVEYWDSESSPRRWVREESFTTKAVVRTEAVSLRQSRQWQTKTWVRSSPSTGCLMQL
jgi:hypothetical protein